MSKGGRRWTKWYLKGEQDFSAGIPLDRCPCPDALGEKYEAWIAGWWGADRERRYGVKKASETRKYLISFVLTEKKWRMVERLLESETAIEMLGSITTGGMKESVDRAILEGKTAADEPMTEAPEVTRWKSKYIPVAERTEEETNEF